MGCRGRDSKWQKNKTVALHLEKGLSEASRWEESRQEREMLGAV